MTGSGVLLYPYSSSWTGKPTQNTKDSKVSCPANVRPLAVDAASIRERPSAKCPKAPLNYGTLRWKLRGSPAGQRVKQDETTGEVSCDFRRLRVRRLLGFSSFLGPVRESERTDAWDRRKLCGSKRNSSFFMGIRKTCSMNFNNELMELLLHQRYQANQNRLCLCKDQVHPMTAECSMLWQVSGTSNLLSLCKIISPPFTLLLAFAFRKGITKTCQQGIHS